MRFLLVLRVRVGFGTGETFQASPNEHLYFLLSQELHFTQAEQAYVTPHAKTWLARPDMTSLSLLDIH